MLTWLRTRLHHNMVDKWTKGHPGARESTKPFPPTSNLSRRSAAAIARLRAALTGVNPSPLRTANLCKCGNATESSKPLLLDYTEIQPTLARILLLRGHKGPITWVSITNENIKPRELFRFRATTGLPRMWYIATSDHEARDAGFELMKDI